MADGVTFADVKASVLNTFEKVFELIGCIVSLIKMVK